MSDADGVDGYLRTEFLERIAHELRGPAGVTLGALDELALVANSDSARLEMLLLMARRSVQRVLRTAERLQRSAQLEAGAVDWAREPCDVRQLVTSVVAAVELLDARKGIAVVATLPDAPCVALLDGPWMTVALSELLANAIRNARTTAAVSATRDGDMMRFSVTDDGVGFSGPALKRFSRPLRRQGLGLSLALVEDVARAHGGHLTIDAPDSASALPGARVHLTFPISAT